MGNVFYIIYLIAATAWQHVKDFFHHIFHH